MLLLISAFYLLPTFYGVFGRIYASDLIALAGSDTTTQNLLDKLNLWLCANQLSSTTLSTIKTGVDGMLSDTDLRKRYRLYAAIAMVMSSHEYLVQK